MDQPSNEESSGFVSGLGVTGDPEAMLELYQQFEAVCPDMLYVSDLIEGKPLLVNDNCQSVIGYPAIEVLAMGAAFPRLVTYPDDLQTHLEFRERIRQCEDDRLHEVEYRAVVRDGSIRWIRRREKVFRRDESGRPIESIGIAEDVTERRRIADALEFYVMQNHEARIELEQLRNELETLNSRLESMAFYDGLTGAWNRNYLAAKMVESDLEAAAVVLFDVDKFKDYNDTHGHIEGDQVLKSLVQASRAVCPPDVYLSRYGGEEFLVFMPLATRSEAMSLAETLRVAIEEMADLKRTVTASFGVATWRASFCEPGHMIAAADLALYHSKATGRNRVTGIHELDEASQTWPKST